MKQIITILFISLFLTTCNSQTNTTNHSIKVKEKAEIMGQLFLKKDFNSLIDFTYPKLIEMSGGREKMLKQITEWVTEMKTEGIEFSNITFGNPSEIITINKELQCTLPQNIELKVPNGRLASQSTLIAISTDNGQNWYFIDSSGKDIQTMKNMLPNLSEDLVIPLQDKPTFYEN